MLPLPLVSCTMERVPPEPTTSLSGEVATWVKLSV
ncbi:MAG: hypothetical protein BWZ09_02627 [Alphaproteobacteria bacterium ADurb.BinA305]|nr:MAG: hypothetical protein BWZ09_02627 [Alphaproteobacteria bacterium ADurb.BinA305]